MPTCNDALNPEQVQGEVTRVQFWAPRLQEGHWGPGVQSKKGNKAVKVLEHKSYGEGLTELGSSNLKEFQEILLLSTASL